MGGFLRMKGRRQWRGRRVWVADADGNNRRQGILRREDGASVLIRDDGMAGLRVLPKAAEGVRWGFLTDESERGVKAS